MEALLDKKTISKPIRAKEEEMAHPVPTKGFI